MDIWKQLLTAGFAHLLNLILAIYLQSVTKEGNGCVWYLVTLLMDVGLGVITAYLLFKIVDEIAIKFGIEVLKSGVYIDANVPVVPEEEDDLVDLDEHVSLVTWFIQLVVWCICTFLAKFLVFYVQMVFHKEMSTWGIAVLAIFKGHPKSELVVVMIFLPVVFNTTVLWIQDAFLKGDKHMDARKAA